MGGGKISGYPMQAGHFESTRNAMIYVNLPTRCYLCFPFMSLEAPNYLPNLPPKEEMVLVPKPPGLGLSNSPLSPFAYPCFLCSGS